ncbi:MAG: caspase family protein [Alphaproteobacteria bacterium]|jgi:hypothetical protein|nr:caspase family protein [Alphaproteobacteria bacterium]
MKAEREREEAIARKAAAEAAAAEAQQRAVEAEAEERRQASLARRQATEAEAAQKRRAAKTAQRAAEEAAHRQRLAALTIGLKPVNIFMDVAIDNAAMRDLPQRTGRELKRITNGRQVHVVAMLPSGWVQIAEEGEPVGWMHRGALRASASVASSSAPATRAAVSPLYATNYPFPEAKPNPNGIALIVGNKKYRHGDVPEVSYAQNDAEAIRQYVVKTLGYSDRNVVVLRDAGKADLQAWFGSASDAQGRLFDMVRAGQSEVFVYYSGHGVPGKAGSGFLLPTDGDPDKAQLTGYSIETLVANLNKLKARTVSLALDTCFSGLSQGGALVEAASGIYLASKVPAGITNGVMLTAADGKQIASWDEGAQLGLFTRHLLEGLLGKADTKAGDGDGKVTLAEIRAHLQDEVSYQARRRYGRAQTPQALGHGNQIVAGLTAPNFPGFGNAEPAMNVQSQRSAPRRQERSAAPTTDAGGNVLERLFKGSTAPKQTEEERFDN